MEELREVEVKRAVGTAALRKTFLLHSLLKKFLKVAAKILQIGGRILNFGSEFQDARIQ